MASHLKYCFRKNRDLDKTGNETKQGIRRALVRASMESVTRKLPVGYT